MNKKINFFKMFVLSSFLLGGIEDVQANISPEDFVDNFHSFYNIGELLNKDFAAEWENRMEQCDKDVAYLNQNNRSQAIHGYDHFFYRKDINDKFKKYITTNEFKNKPDYIQSQIRNKVEQYNVIYFYYAHDMINDKICYYLDKISKKYPNASFNELYNMINMTDINSICDVLKEFYKNRKDYSDHVINRFFLGGKKEGSDAHYSGMISLIENVPYYANGDNRTLESLEDSYIKRFSKYTTVSVGSLREKLKSMLAFVIAHSVCFNNGLTFYEYMEDDLTGGCERGKTNRLLQYIEKSGFDDNGYSMISANKLFDMLADKCPENGDEILGKKISAINDNDNGLEITYCNKKRVIIENGKSSKNIGKDNDFSSDKSNEDFMDNSNADSEDWYKSSLFVNNDNRQQNAYQNYDNEQYIKTLNEKNKKLDDYLFIVESLREEFSNNSGQSDHSLLRDQLCGFWDELVKEYSDFIDKKEVSLNMNHDIEELIFDVACLINAIKTKMEGRGDSTIDFSQDEPHSNNSIRNAQNNVIEELDGYCNRINNIVRSGDEDRKYQLINMYHEFLDKYLNKYSDYIDEKDRSLNEDDGIQDFYNNFIGLITKVQDMLR